MSGFIARQPNGLLCRFSSIVDAPTHWNMTAADYADYCASVAREEAYRTVMFRTKPFDWIDEYFRPGEMTKRQYKQFIKECNEPPVKKPEEREISISEVKEAIDYVFEQLEIQDSEVRKGLDPLYKQLMMAIDMLSHKKEEL